MNVVHGKDGVCERHCTAMIILTLPAEFDRSETPTGPQADYGRPSSPAYLIMVHYEAF